MPAGERLQLEPHPGSCDPSELRERFTSHDKPLAVDLFCGAGGLSLCLAEAGFEVILGIDSNPFAIETHRHHFGGASLRCDLSDPSEIQSVLDAIMGLPIALLAGGPPCQPFSRAGRPKIKSLVRSGARPAVDKRTELWRSFVRFTKELSVDAILFENVPDLGVGANAPVFRALVSELENAGYHLDSRILSAADYGVPQYRKRLYVVGFLRQSAGFGWPSAIADAVTVRDAISDLPEIVPGELKNPRVLGEASTDFQSRMRGGQPDGGPVPVFDHNARSVRKDDLEAFRMMTSDTKYSDLPEYLPSQESGQTLTIRRYRANIFTDKYHRLSWDKPSRTITAHIAKDGYWYIHP